MYVFTTTSKREKKYHSSLKKLDAMWINGLSVSSKRLLWPKAQGRSSERPIPFDVPEEYNKH